MRANGRDSLSILVKERVIALRLHMTRATRSRAIQYYSVKSDGLVDKRSCVFRTFQRRGHVAGNIGFQSFHADNED